MLSKYEEDLAATGDVLEATIGCSEVLEVFSKKPFVNFIGCGTSFSIAETAAAFYETVSQGNCRAVTSSRAFLYPEIVFRSRNASVAVLISRSGESVETVKAMEAAKSAGFATVAVTCASKSRMAVAADFGVCLDHAMERTILESFSTESLLAAACMAFGLKIPGGKMQYPKLAGRFATFMERFSAKSFRRFLCIGEGPLSGVAEECSLKLAELTGLPSEAYSSYEYRHGPRMWADEGTFALVLSGVRAIHDEQKAAKELLSFGSSVIWLGKGEGAGDCFDVEESCEIDALFRKSFTAKLCGVSFGRRLSRDFDHPAHLLHSVKEL